MFLDELWCVPFCISLLRDQEHSPFCTEETELGLNRSPSSRQDGALGQEGRGGEGLGRIGH